jgi:hypothetical protein
MQQSKKQEQAQENETFFSSLLGSQNHGKRFSRKIFQPGVVLDTIQCPRPS